MWARLKPAFALLLLAPLISEYLLGSLSFRQLWLFPIMVPIYGGGALLIREVTRRTGRGWPTILMLGLAFAVIEEGLATQSLFNPGYLGLQLLRYGFVPALGLGASWTVYVVLLHTVWSIAVPIGWVEALFPAQRGTRWLGRAGLGITSAVYVVGVALIACGTWKREQFMASPAQRMTTALIALGLVAGAWLFFPGRRHAGETTAPTRARPWRLGAVTFGGGALFHLLAQIGQAFLPAAASVLGMLLLPVAVFAIVRPRPNSGGWSSKQTDALVLGALLVDCGLGFFMVERLHGEDAVPGQFFPCLVVLVLVGVRWRRARKSGFNGVA